MSEMGSTQGATEAAQICHEYDFAASVTRTVAGPRWNERPARCHITAELMSDDEAATFIELAYSITEGCRDDVLHGDLRKSPPDTPAPRAAEHDGEAL